MDKNLRVSVVIPVYNEEEQLSACLRAIEAQTVRPYEVIVVDNNSTDSTAAIARQFPFVTLLHESRQGVVHARNRGFNATRGDIIGRIDADTLLPANWVRQLQNIFSNKTIEAVSGSLHYYDIAGSKAVDAVDYYMRGWMSRRMHSHTFLLGSNMGLRRNAWQLVRDDVCNSGNMHEDLDLAVHLVENGKKVVYEARLIADVSARRIDVSIVDLSRYMFLSPKTYARHQIHERKYMYPLIAIVFLNYLQLRLLFRGYDVAKRRFSLETLLNSETLDRANPGIYN